MIIVNQDRNEIINFERITEIVASRNTISIADNIYEETGEIIGEYATEERAKEVLQEIVNRYKFNRCEAVENAVYEMPEK